MWSRHLHRVYAARRKITAENQYIAGQESEDYPAQLDPGLNLAFWPMPAVNFGD
jgi:hypothetical protein